MQKISIHDSGKIIHLFNSLKEPSYREKQLYISLYKNFISNIDEIMNFSLGLREELKKKVRISTLQTKIIQKSKKDKTVKFLLIRKEFQLCQSRDT